MQQTLIGKRRTALHRQAALYIVLFVLAAALVVALWLCADTPVAIVFTCLGALLAGVEALSFCLTLLGAIRLAAAAAPQYRCAVLTGGGAALFWEEDSPETQAFAKTLLQAEEASARKTRREAKRQARQLQRALPKPLKIRGFTQDDLAQMQGKTFYVGTAAAPLQTAERSGNRFVTLGSQTDADEEQRR